MSEMLVFGRHIDLLDDVVGQVGVRNHVPLVVHQEAVRGIRGAESLGHSVIQDLKNGIKLFRYLDSQW